jgi:hypothetical protein
MPGRKIQHPYARPIGKLLPEQNLVPEREAPQTDHVGIHPPATLQVVQLPAEPIGKNGISPVAAEQGALRQNSVGIPEADPVGDTTDIAVDIEVVRVAILQK